MKIIIVARDFQAETPGSLLISKIIMYNMESTVILNLDTGEIYLNRAEAKESLGGSGEYNRRWKTGRIIPILPSVLKKASENLVLTD